MTIPPRHEGVEFDELFLTGGIEKKSILDVLWPQISFDDEIRYLLDDMADGLPSLLKLKTAPEPLGVDLVGHSEPEITF